MDEAPEEECATAPPKAQGDSAAVAHGKLPLTGPAAVAILRSNEVPTQHRPARAPHLTKYFRRNVKKPSRRLKPPKGKVIDGRHEQYTITYSMQLGIQRSVEYAANALPASFEEACAETLKTRFDPDGTPETPEHALRHSFVVKDYAPCVFAKIRALMGVTPELYLESLCSGLSFIEFFANSRSGQFFFYSFDGVFMIKTVRKDEKAFLLKILPQYYRHLRAHALPGSPESRAEDSPSGFFPNGNSSLLSRFYGLHCTKLRHLRRKVHFVVMGSIWGANTSPRMAQYDLKGSEVHRAAKPGERVLKDKDARQADLKLRVGTGRALRLVDSLKSDAAFLARNGAMDYSLLIGIYDEGERFKNGASSANGASPASAQPKPPTPPPRQKGVLSAFNKRLFARLPTALDGATAFEAFAEAPPPRPPSPANDEAASSRSHEGRSDAEADGHGEIGIGGKGPQGRRELYYLGIIDFLQLYNARKRAETTWNVFGHGAGWRKCSCVSPADYEKRFVSFVSQIFE